MRKGEQLSIREFLAVVVAVFILVGCGAQPPASQPADAGPGQSPAQAPPTTQEAAQPFGPGEFTFTADGGGTGVLQLPGTAVPEIEELRKLVKGPAVDYVTARVDNRAGTQPVNMNEIQVFDPDGRQYTYTGAAAYIWDLQQQLPDGTPVPVYNKYVDLHNQYLDDAAPKEAKDFVLVGEPVPEQISGVTVYAAGGSNPVEASPVK